MEDHRGRCAILVLRVALACNVGDIFLRAVTGMVSLGSDHLISGLDVRGACRVVLKRVKSLPLSCLGRDRGTDVRTGEWRRSRSILRLYFSIPVPLDTAE